MAQIGRTPTLLQKLSVASYIYFIPLALVLNLLCLFNKYTFCIWLMWVTAGEPHTGRLAGTTGVALTAGLWQCLSNFRLPVAADTHYTSTLAQAKPPADVEHGPHL